MSKSWTISSGAFPTFQSIEQQSGSEIQLRKELFYEPNQNKRMEGITIHLLPKGNWTGASVFEPETKHSDPMRITIMVLSSNTIK